MTRILIAYGTTEGQTRKVAASLADRFKNLSHHVELVDAAAPAAALGPEGFDGTIVAGSVHRGRYQPSVIAFVQKHLAGLVAKPSAFVSVSLSAAGKDQADCDSLAKCIADFTAKAGWSPARVHHAGGALMYSKYNFLVRWIMKRIARKRGAPTDTSRDHELTDWVALGRFADEFVAAAAIPSRAAAN